MPKILVLSILALTSGLMLNAAQQVHQQNVANVAEVRAKARPVPDTPQPDSSLDDTLRWIQQKLPAPFEVDVQAGGHLSETVSYSTVLVDWKGCSVHFRSERNHTLNGEIDKHTVEQIIPLRDVDPSRIQPYPLQVPGLIWDVPGISISTSYDRRTIVDTFQAPHQNTYYTNLTYTDESEDSEDSEPRMIAALQHAVAVCGGRPDTF
jgi:hypothetical protein